MDQAERAMAYLADDGRDEGVIPWQIIKRPGAEPLRAYAVTEFRWMLDLCRMRQGAIEKRAW
jgi:hypothetical protein